MPGKSYDHTDPETLRELYHNRDLSLRDVADYCGVSHSAILYHMDKHGIQKKQYHTADDAIYKDKDWLEVQYWDNQLSLDEMANKAGVHRGTIHKWMKKLGVDRRTAYDEQGYASITVNKNGYIVWEHHDGESKCKIRVHRLLAVAEYGFEAVCGKDVHHTTDIPWDNRPSALELLSREEHARLHGENRKSQQRELMAELREKGKL